MPCPAGSAPPALTLAQVLREALRIGPWRGPPHHWKILNALIACRTMQLGGHRYRCQECGRDHFVPRSCGNRHCPTCQGHQAAEWLERQKALLLPVPYYHVVFTLPHELNPVIRRNRAALYKLFFASVSGTLLEFGSNNLGAQLGLTIILHTWSQTLLDHYHLHCIVTGGGLAMDGSGWKSAGGKFLFPVVALGQVFRTRFCEGLQRLFGSGKLELTGQLEPLRNPPQFQALVRSATAKAWNVYVKRPFAGPEQVLGYLGRYTHRVAIGNRRLLHLDSREGTIQFRYKIRRDPAPPAWTKMTLSLTEFLRRYGLHLLPPRFVKIRHYGLLANRGRQERVRRAQSMLGVAETESTVEALPEVGRMESPRPAQRCPYCGAAALVWVELVPASTRAPPPIRHAA